VFDVLNGTVRVCHMQQCLVANSSGGRKFHIFGAGVQKAQEPNERLRSGSGNESKWLADEYGDLVGLCCNTVKGLRGMLDINSGHHRVTN